MELKDLKIIYEYQIGYIYNACYTFITEHKKKKIKKQPVEKYYQKETAMSLILLQLPQGVIEMIHSMKFHLLLSH